MKKLSRCVLAMAIATGMAVAQAAPAQSNGAKKMEQKPAPTPVGVTVEPSKLFDRAVSNIEQEFVSLAEAMPADKWDYAPTEGDHKGVQTFGDMVRHVAQANTAYFGAVLGQKMSP